MQGKQLLALILAFLLISPLDLRAYAARFVDMSDNWAEKYVNTLSDRNIIGKEESGKFSPNEPITRAVLADWLVKVLGLENQPVASQPSFADVKPTDWYYKSVEIIRQNNYISGYADGFRPNQFIQKAEVLIIIARTLNSPSLSEGQVSAELAKYKDSDKIPNWAKEGIAQCSIAGVVVNHPDPAIVKATDIATRADVAACLYELQEHSTRKTIADSAAKVNNPNTASNNSNSPVNYQPYDDSQYQGRVISQDSFNANTANAQISQMPPGNNYGGQYNFTPGNYQQASPYQQQPPPGYLQGGVAVISAGTQLKTTLKNTLNSGSTQPGEEIRATLAEALYSNGTEVVPAGSKIIGQVTSVISAKRFRFGANGKMDLKFTSIETPDGRRFPLSASVDTNQIRLVGGTTKGRVGKSLMYTGIGAGGGAALGTALGAIVGATGGGRVGKSTGMGAIFGTAIGAGVGGVGAAVRKGGEVKLPAGMDLPIKLDESLQVTVGRPPYQQQMPYGGGMQQQQAFPEQ
jgi:hypothetical protein